MRSRALEAASDGLILSGGLALLVSLFLTWSHQYPRSLLGVPALSLALTGVPRDASAWQVYSAADVLLAALVLALVGAALVGRRRARLGILVAVLAALAFTAHASSVPPTSGLDVVDPAAAGRGYLGHSRARAGVGETVALAALAAAGVGLAVGVVAVRD